VSVRVNFVLRPHVSSEEEWGCSRNSVRVTHPPVFRRRFRGLNVSASTPAMRVELISQDRAQSRMHVGAGFEQGDVRAGSEQTILYEIIGSVTIAAEQNREDSELWDRCEHALVSRRLCSHSRRLKRL
jgi:hypothetical protein